MAQKKEEECVTLPSVLVVVSFPLIGELITSRLRAEGMYPREWDGTSRLDDPCDLVIIDCGDHGGQKVLEQIHANPRTANLPVIFFTSGVTHKTAEELGVDFCITKPFSGLDLMRKVRTCLKKETR